MDPTLILPRYLTHAQPGLVDDMVALLDDGGNFIVF